jgi:cytochrome c oxidase cbb3-type subunit IV
MLKFIKGHMAGLDNVELYPLIAMLLFISIFVGWTIYALRSNKAHINHMSELPLEDQPKQ